jgi:hypothetical protein
MHLPKCSQAAHNVSDFNFSNLILKLSQALLCGQNKLLQATPVMIAFTWG